MPPDIKEGSAGSGDRAPSLLSLLLNWRDWSIPTKLAAVTLVPVIFAVVLGAMQIGDQVRRADSYRRVDRLVTVNDQARQLVDTLQRERTATTALLAMGPANAAARGDELLGERQAVDGVRDTLARAAGRAGFQSEITVTRFTEVSARLDDLSGLREAAVTGRTDPPGALAGYTLVIGALLNFERAAAAEVIDPTLATTAAALHDLELAKEELRYQQALLGMGLAGGGLADNQLAALRASQARLADRFADFGLDATAEQQRIFAGTVGGSEVDARANLVRVAMDTAAHRPLPIDPAAWHASTDSTADRTSDVIGGLGARIAQRSTELQGEASDGAGFASVILLVALVVAGAVMFVVGRQLLRSLNMLRRSALDVAEHELPEAVERIRDGRGAQEPVVEPVPVRTADEIGQVARAFDAVHRQALRLATEQAGLRARYGDVFVNLSRRSQGLVQRQLQLLERLERDEEDPEQLDTLFQLDHLATRMRRNNENLMVLSGSELGRRNQRPATLADLLRAAVSEIEQYQRVVLLPPPEVLVVGYAVGDLVRLVAELLDNATAFSAPGTQVTIAGHSFEDGSVCVAILDEGIGMSESELAAANAKLADARTVDVSTSRRMGLFVVGRLAGRHGVEASLHGGKDIQGVRATVTLPAELITRPSPRLPERATEPGASTTNGHGPANGTRVNGLVPSPLPRRKNLSNGSSTSDIERRLGGEPVPAAPDHQSTSDEKRETGAEEHRPLPRRSPGASAFAKPVDTEAGPVDLATPGDPVPPAGSLFQPSVSAWWGANGESAVEETTPIFDEMVSAWFRSITDRDDGERGDEDWRFAADEGFLAAQQVSRSQPDSFTDSGLPRRNPRQNLVPGSAGTPDGGPDTFGRDAVEVRDRLASYRQGVSRARDERLVADCVDDGADHGPPTLDLSEAGWRFVSQPADHGAGGLPQRAPRGADQPAADGGLRVDHAVELRGRLGNFQRGLDRGRRSLADLADRMTGAPGDELAAPGQPDPADPRKSYETGE